MNRLIEDKPSMEPPKYQALPSEYAKQPQESPYNGGLSPQENYQAPLFQYQLQQTRSSGQSYSDYHDLLRHRLLHQERQLQLRRKELQASDGRHSLTSFLHCQDNSFFTPWCSKEEGRFVYGADGKPCMVFEPGSFFANDVPYVKPEEPQIIHKQNHVTK